MTDPNLLTWSDVVGNYLSAPELVELARASGLPLADWLREEAGLLYSRDDLAGLDFDRLAAELKKDAAEVVETQGDQTVAPPVTFVCDLCGFQTHDQAVVTDHLHTAHGVAEVGEVGRLTQEAGRLTLKSGDRTTVVDLNAFAADLLADQEEEEQP